MSKMNSFVKQFVAAVKGDDVEVQAQKAWRSAESALKVQIAAREGDTISLEDTVNIAKEELVKARINYGQPITNREEYIDTLIDAKNDLTEAEQELNFHMEELNFLKEEYKALNAE
jgi:hypothetical protein